MLKRLSWNLHEFKYSKDMSCKEIHPNITSIGTQAKKMRFHFSKKWSWTCFNSMWRLRCSRATVTRRLCVCTKHSYGLARFALTHRHMDLMVQSHSSHWTLCLFISHGLEVQLCTKPNSPSTFTDSFDHYKWIEFICEAIRPLTCYTIALAICSEFCKSAV